MLADPRLRPCAIDGFEQDVERLVEFDPGRIEVAELKFRLASVEMAVRDGDEVGYRVHDQLG